MGTSRNTLAQSVQQTLSTQGYTVSLGIIQFFIALSKPLRNTIRSYLEMMEAQLQVQKSKAIAEFKRGDFLSDKINKFRNAATIMLGPIDRLMQQIPIDSAINESPLLQDELVEQAQTLKDLIGSIPLTISPEVLSQIGFDDFSMFEGVNSYKDLRDKVDELEFRSARVVALSEYAVKGITYIENQLQKINIYKKIIEVLGT